jgi:hypothetical protein
MMNTALFIPHEPSHRHPCWQPDGLALDLGLHGVWVLPRPTPYLELSDVGDEILPYPGVTVNGVKWPGWRRHVAAVLGERLDGGTGGVAMSAMAVECLKFNYDLPDHDLAAVLSLAGAYEAVFSCLFSDPVEAATRTLPRGGCRGESERG